MVIAGHIFGHKISSLKMANCIVFLFLATQTTLTSYYEPFL